MPDRSTLTALAFEISLLVAGIVLLWRFVLRPAVRREPAPVALPPWAIALSEFLLFLFLVVSGAYVATFTVASAFKSVFFPSDLEITLPIAAGQLGALAGIALFHGFLEKRLEPEAVAARDPRFVLTGTITFIIAMPVIAAVSFLWQGLLRIFHIPAEPQNLIRLFGESDSLAFVVIMAVLACVGAPVMEELVFRRGIFRYVRTRLPRWAAFLLPAVLFGAMHGYLDGFAPLVALGIIFSLAYERTGNIKTTMVAHALFNLNSIVLIFTGTGS